MQIESALDRSHLVDNIQCLDDLTDVSTEQLWQLYRTADTPEIEDLEGRLVGRMLTVPGMEKPAVAKFLNRFAASGRFPWQGKTFESHRDGTGQGINRVLGNRRDWFRFDTFIGPSRAGDFDSLHLNYDNPGNPRFIRAVKDEVREVAPGIWLGLAYLRLPGGNYHMALFFALSNHENETMTQPQFEAKSSSDLKKFAPLLAISAVLGLLWLFKKRPKR